MAGILEGYVAEEATRKVEGMIRNTLFVLRMSFLVLMFQLVSLAVVALLSKTGLGGQTPQKILESCWSIYAPGVEVAKDITPETWWTRQTVPMGVFSVGAAMVVYSVVVGMAITLVFSALRFATKKR